MLVVLTTLPALVMWGIWVLMKRLNTGIWVTGVDSKAGTIERRRFPGSGEEGGITWKKRKGDDCLLVLDDSYRFGGRLGPEFLADVSQGEGRLMRPVASGDVMGMPGSRAWALVIGQAVKQISDSARTDFQSLLKTAIIGGLVALVIIGGLVIYLIKMLHDAGVA